MTNSAFANNILPRANSKDILVQNLDGEVLLYNLNSNQAFHLNKTASLVWNYCDGHNNTSDIINLIKQEKKIDLSEEFISLSLTELYKRNLLVNSDELNEAASKFNRREAIKKIGLTTLIAFPIITSIIAPTAANAASAALDGTCQANTCAAIGAPCNCGAATICPPGFIINVGATVGTCVSIGTITPVILPPINIGLGVCLVTNVCI